MKSHFFAFLLLLLSVIEHSKNVFIDNLLNVPSIELLQSALMAQCFTRRHSAGKRSSVLKKKISWGRGTLTTEWMRAMVWTTSELNIEFSSAALLLLEHSLCYKRLLPCVVVYEVRVVYTGNVVAVHVHFQTLAFCYHFDDRYLQKLIHICSLVSLFCDLDSV